MYTYGQIALAIARAITDHTRTSKSTDYCPNCTLKCVINYTYNAFTCQSCNCNFRGYTKLTEAHSLIFIVIIINYDIVVNYYNTSVLHVIGVVVCCTCIQCKGPCPKSLWQT